MVNIHNPFGHIHTQALEGVNFFQINVLSRRRSFQQNVVYLHINNCQDLTNLLPPQDEKVITNDLLVHHDHT